jgi:hypothetical protein
MLAKHLLKKALKVSSLILKHELILSLYIVIALFKAIASLYYPLMSPIEFHYNLKSFKRAYPLAS